VFDTGAGGPSSPSAPGSRSKTLQPPAGAASAGWLPLAGELTRTWRRARLAGDLGAETL
jgi:hypothetical protein